PRLNAGLAPVSTVVQDVNGDGIPDLLVTNSGSNDVFMLPGRPGATFDDRNPVVFDVGADPREALVGDFNGDGRPDWVTVNAGSNDLPLISDFAHSTAGQAVGSGGAGPVAALMGDFDRNGFTDLLVANNDNGVFSVLMGGPGGLSLEESVSFAGVAH